MRAMFSFMAAWCSTMGLQRWCQAMCAEVAGRQQDTCGGRTGAAVALSEGKEAATATPTNGSASAAAGSSSGASLWVVLSHHAARFLLHRQGCRPGLVNVLGRHVLSREEGRGGGKEAGLGCWAQADRGSATAAGNSQLQAGRAGCRLPLYCLLAPP